MTSRNHGGWVTLRALVWTGAAWAAIAAAWTGWPRAGVRAPMPAAFSIASPTPDTAGEQPEASPAPAGWYAIYSAANKSAGKGEVKTLAQSPMFALPAGATIHPLVEPGASTIEYSGLVRIDDPGKYRFGAECDGGSTTITVFDGAGKSLAKITGDGAARAVNLTTPMIQLPKGEVQVGFKFVRRGDGAARLRPFWEMERSGLAGFRAEAIPAGVVSVPKFGRQAAAAGHEADRGRSVISELGCASCHDAGRASASVLAADAPLLGEIGRRADPAWILKWILDPTALKPRTTMPDVFGDSPQDRADAEAIVHFLSAPHADSAPSRPAATEKDVIAQGRYLYHTVGCVACHGPLDSPASAFWWVAGLSKEAPKVEAAAPFGDLKGKWRPAALAEFLKDPLRTHPGGRMPSLNLSVEEADLLTSYLISLWGAAPTGVEFQADAAKINAGREAFAARGCAECHAIGHNLPNVASTLKAPGLAGLTAGKGCLDPKSTKSPRFALSAEQRAAVSAALPTIAGLTAAAAPLDAMHRTMDVLNCAACHAKDGSGGPGAEINTYFRSENDAELGDEGRLPPNLSGVGFKLTTNWLRQALTARGVARPYMSARMPQFGEANVGGLPEALGADSGLWPNSGRDEPKPSDELVRAGHRLVGDTALNCISCHVFGDYPPAGTPGPNITEFAGRLRYDWWKNYVMAPTRAKPNTRMPAFYQTGKGAVTDLFGGDPDKQADAMWAYFNVGEFAPVPSGVNTGQGYVIAVKDRPAIFRTFLKDAGSRGIAVGFPQGLHFAFDAGACRLVDAWRGGFIDASGAWANRGGTVTDTKGTLAWSATPGPAVVVDNADKPLGWPGVTATPPGGVFKGYSLDKAGVPTFKYAIGAVEVTERFEPGGSAAVLMSRRFTLDAAGFKPGTKVFVNAGKGKPTMTGVTGATSAPRQADDGSTWFELAPNASGVKFVLEYSQ